MLRLTSIAERLALHTPARISLEGRRSAAVSLVLRDSGSAAKPSDASLEVLFIERARHEGDPWSGHIAFPGGRAEPEDDSERVTAERETYEEVGIGLESGQYLGQLDDLSGLAAAASRMVVSAHVYHLSEPGRLVANHEVEEAFWFPVRDLVDPARHIQQTIPIGGREIEFPGVILNGEERPVLWGLTYRFIESFFELIDHPFPGDHRRQEVGR